MNFCFLKLFIKFQGLANLTFSTGGEIVWFCSLSVSFITMFDSNLKLMGCKWVILNNYYFWIKCRSHNKLNVIGLDQL